MVWREIQIKTWSDLMTQIDAIKSSKMVYRGQSDIDYCLESSLKRELNLFNNIHKKSGESIEQMFIRLESRFIKIYKSESHLYSDDNFHIDNDDLSCLSILQHYGAPTRLLDWSYSPYISTYFAVSNKFDKDAVLYALDLEYISRLNPNKIQEYYSASGKQSKEISIMLFGRFYADQKARSDKKGDTFTEEIILVGYEPSKKNIRLARQQGLFLVSSKIDVNYEEVISSYGIGNGKSTDGKENVALKFRIDRKIKLDIMKNLQLMNISSEILFPEMEGYCKGLKYKLINDNYTTNRREV